MVIPVTTGENYTENKATIRRKWLNINVLNLVGASCNLLGRLACMDFMLSCAAGLQNSTAGRVKRLQKEPKTLRLAPICNRYLFVANKKHIIHNFFMTRTSNIPFSPA